MEVGGRRCDGGEPEWFDHDSWITYHNMMDQMLLSNSSHTIFEQKLNDHLPEKSVPVARYRL